MLRFVSRVSLVGVALMVPLSGAQAQAGTANQRWQAWVGCWQPIVQMAPTDVALSDDATEADRAVARRAFAMLDSVRRREISRAPIVCVIPSGAPSSVDIVTIDSGKVASRYTVVASGQQRTVDRDGCAGWEKAQWSRDSLRVFLRSELTCTGSVRRLSSGIMSMSPDGEWVDVQTVIAGGNEVVRTVRYREAGVPSAVPADIASSVTNARRLDARTASFAAGAQLNAAAIAEAAKMVDTSAVQAWLVERRQRFEVDGRTLVALADAGVPGSVTDVMVALSYPEIFRFDHGPSADGRDLTRADSARIAAEYARDQRYGCDSYGRYSSFGWGGDPCYAYRHGYGLSRYGYGGYGYDYGYGGIGGYYNPYYGYYGRPVVIVREPETAHGRAVKGQGYTRGTSSSSGSAASASSGGYSSGKSASPSSGSSSSGASKSSEPAKSSGSSGDGGRTAKARPPQ